MTILFSVCSHVGKVKQLRYGCSTRPCRNNSCAAPVLTRAQAMWKAFKGYPFHKVKIHESVRKLTELLTKRGPCSRN